MHITSISFLESYWKQPLWWIWQAAALLLFNASERLSYAEVMTQLNLTDDDVIRLLHSLSCAKYKILVKEPNTKTISPNDVFTFNNKFTDRMRRIKVLLFSCLVRGSNQIKWMFNRILFTVTRILVETRTCVCCPFFVYMFFYFIFSIAETFNIMHTHLSLGWGFSSSTWIVRMPSYYLVFLWPFLYAYNLPHLIMIAERGRESIMNNRLN